MEMTRPFSHVLAERLRGGRQDQYKTQKVVQMGKRKAEPKQYQTLLTSVHADTLRQLAQVCENRGISSVIALREAVELWLDKQRMQPSKEQIERAVQVLESWGNGPGGMGGKTKG